MTLKFIRHVSPRWILKRFNILESQYTYLKKPDVYKLTDARHELRCRNCAGVLFKTHPMCGYSYVCLYCCEYMYEFQIVTLA